MINTTTKKKPCGCKTKFAHLSGMIIETTEHCQQHNLEKKEKTRLKKEQFIIRLKATTEEIKCNICHKHICYVNTSDLNCSYFICDICHNDNKS